MKKNETNPKLDTVHSFFEEYFPKWLLITMGICFVLVGLAIGWNLVLKGKAAEGLGLMAILVGSGVGSTAIAFLPATVRDNTHIAGAFDWAGPVEPEEVPASSQSEVHAMASGQGA